MKSATMNGVVSLENLIEEFASRLEAGEVLDVAEFAAAHPEYAEQLLYRVLPTMLLLAGLQRLGEAPMPRPCFLGQYDTEPVPGMLGDFRIIRGKWVAAAWGSSTRRMALPRSTAARRSQDAHRRAPTLERTERGGFLPRGAEAVASSCHANIVQVWLYDVGDLDGRPYFT